VSVALVAGHTPYVVHSYDDASKATEEDHGASKAKDEDDGHPFPTATELAAVGAAYHGVAPSERRGSGMDPALRR
jgi:hypothetical protein